MTALLKYLDLGGADCAVHPVEQEWRNSNSLVTSLFICTARYIYLDTRSFCAFLYHEMGHSCDLIKMLCSYLKIGAGSDGKQGIK